MEMYRELMVMMKNEYDELHTLFGSKLKSVTVQAPVPVQPVQQVQPVQPEQAVQQTEQATTQEQETKVVVVGQESDSKKMKLWQKEQEQKKLAELQAAGVVPETLLTADNVRQWVEKEAKTYAYVAREYLGMPEAKVAEFGKKNGILSQMSKKRAVVAANAFVKNIRKN
jgi:2-succinyl-5-enolpyruvyl-6-hydroxy-3-cyclohexene-1-carboxylate synthase